MRDYNRDQAQRERNARELRDNLRERSERRERIRETSFASYVTSSDTLPDEYDDYTGLDYSFAIDEAERLYRLSRDS